MTEQKYNGAFSNEAGYLRGGDIAEYLGSGERARVVQIGEVYSDGDADIAAYFDGKPGPGNVKWGSLRPVDPALSALYQQIVGLAVSRKAATVDLPKPPVKPPLKLPLGPSARERERLCKVIMHANENSLHMAEKTLEALHDAGFAVINTIQLRHDQVDHTVEAR